MSSVTAAQARLARFARFNVVFNIFVILWGAFVRATGAPFHSSDIARDKAYTAASFKMPTADIPGIVSGSDALRDGITRRRNMVMFGGGLPIVIDGEIVGGIGVSGGSEAMDTAYANVGLAAMGAKIFD